MKRLTVLLLILGALVLFVLPYLYLDGMLADKRQALELVGEDLATLRLQAQGMQERELQLGERNQSLSGMAARLLGTAPLNQIDQTVREAAKRSGIALERVSIEGPSPVAERADLDRYAVGVRVVGNRTQYLEFLRSLEEHALLIELPELALTLQPGATAPIQQEIELGFYAQAVRKPGMDGAN